MKRNLMRAVPPVPERYLAKMDDILKEISDMEHLKKHRYSYGALAVALALLIALAGLAYAAATQSGILDRLFPGVTPPPVMERAVVRNAASDSAEGVTLTLDECLYDNATLNLQWTVSSERDEPVYYLVECVGNEDDWSSDSGSLPMDIKSGDFRTLAGLDDPLDIGRNRTDHFRQIMYGTTDNEARLNVYVFTSPLKPVRLPPPPDDDWITWDYDAMRLLEGRGELGISGWNMARISDYHLLFLGMAADERGVRQVQQGRYGDAGYMRPLTTLSIAVQPASNEDMGFWHTEPVARNFTFSGGRIEVVFLDFSPSISRIRYRIYPNMPIGHRYMDNHAMDALLDGQGEMLSYCSSTSYDGGKDYFEIDMDGDPLPEPPAFVYLVPGLDHDEYDMAAENGTLMDYEKIRIDLRVVE